MSKDKVDEIVMVGGSTRIPRIQELVSELFGGKQLNMSINPDEAVAYGAAVNAAILSGKHKDNEKIGGLLLVDVTPLSLGVETEGGLMDILIKRQTTVPHTQTKTYSTAKNNQTNVRIQVYEGERPITKDNNKLGEFQLDGIPPMPRGVPQIEVSFSLNADGILSVSAKDKTSGKENTIRIQNEKGRMSEDEINQKIHEAEEYQKQDELNAKSIQARNEFENYLYSVMSSESTIKDMSDEDKALLNEIAEEGLDWLNDNPSVDPVELKVYRDALEPRVMEIYNKYSNGSSNAETESRDADAAEDADSDDGVEIEAEAEA